MPSELWHWEGRAYRLICEPVSYPQYERRRVDGRMMDVRLPDLQYTVCTAVLIGDDSFAKNPRSHE